MSIQVAILDSNAGAREALATVIRMTPGFGLVACCRTGAGALRELPIALPQVVVLETRLADLTAGDCIRRLRSSLPGLLFLIVTASEDRSEILASLSAGAHGCLRKTARPARVLEAITDLVQGGSPLDAGVARLLVERMHREAAALAQVRRLTRRESEILELMTEGLRVKEAAARLDISAFTAQTHIRNIYNKLEVRTLPEAVAKYRQVRPLILSPVVQAAPTPVTPRLEVPISVPA